MERLLNVIAVFSLVLIVFVLASVRRARIRVEYSVSWLIAGVALLLLSRWPGLEHWLTVMVGPNDAPVALLSAAGAVFLVVLYRFSLIISRLKDSNIALTQRIAILEFRLTSFHEEKKPAARN
jgi:hypothetical protein